MEINNNILTQKESDIINDYHIKRLVNELRKFIYDKNIDIKIIENYSNIGIKIQTAKINNMLYIKFNVNNNNIEAKLYKYGMLNKILGMRLSSDQLFQIIDEIVYETNKLNISKKSKKSINVINSTNSFNDISPHKNLYLNSKYNKPIPNGKLELCDVSKEIYPRKKVNGDNKNTSSWYNYASITKNIKDSFEEKRKYVYNLWDDAA